jgi:hypothetical protein
LRPVLASWSPVTLQRLPFKSVLVASQNDPYCTQTRARAFARAWGSNYIDYGKRGHINADSGLGAWSAGQKLLNQLDQTEQK